MEVQFMHIVTCSVHFLKLWARLFASEQEVRKFFALKLTATVLYNNSDKQCQILTEFWTNNATTPMPDRFIDEHLVEMFPLFDQA